MNHDRTQLSRSGGILAALLLGVPFSAGILAVIHFGPLKGTAVLRYVSHPLECIEVLMFGGALGAMAGKIWSNLRERRACRAAVLPEWNGEQLPVAEAGKLLEGVNGLPRWMQTSVIVQRCRAVLEFLRQRRSAVELDDQLRALADTDAIALESSYGLTRFITWAIPILGFLGTVLGITGAISGVTPEVLEQSLSTVTDGLALAFDATALALGLTMLAMFISYLVERAEQQTLEQVDRFTESELAHRFERLPAEGVAAVEVARQQSTVLIDAVERLVREQARIWSDSLEEVARRQQESSTQQTAILTSGLQAALESTVKTHHERLIAFESHLLQQQNGLSSRLADWTATLAKLGSQQYAAQAEIASALDRQAKAILQIQEATTSLVPLQATLDRNLSLLASSDALEETLHGLSAAVHLLTARARPQRPGAAA